MEERNDEIEARRLHNDLLYNTISIDFCSPQVDGGRNLQRFRSCCRNYLTSPNDVAPSDCESLLECLERLGHIHISKYDVLKDICRFSVPLVKRIEEVQKKIDLIYKRKGQNSVSTEWVKKTEEFHCQRKGDRSYGTGGFQILYQRKGEYSDVKGGVLEDTKESHKPKSDFQTTTFMDNSPNPYNSDSQLNKPIKRAVRADNINIGWQKPEGIQQDEIAFYEIQYKPIGGDISSVRTVKTFDNSQTYHLTDLKVNSEYEFRVRAVLIHDEKDKYDKLT